MKFPNLCAGSCIVGACYPAGRRGLLADVRAHEQQILVNRWAGCTAQRYRLRRWCEALDSLPVVALSAEPASRRYEGRAELWPRRANR
jgi:hypothetical protein